jgi:hypothetical protein
MGICAFPTTAQFWVDEFDMAELCSAASWIEIDGEELLESGQGRSCLIGCAWPLWVLTVNLTSFPID